MLDEQVRLQQIGHELRNALTSILAAAEIIKRRYGPHVESEHEVMTRQIERMRHLVDEMLVLVNRSSGV